MGIGVGTRPGSADGASIPAEPNELGSPPLPVAVRIPLGPNREFDPSGPSTLYGYGSYGAHHLVDDDAEAEATEWRADYPTHAAPQHDRHTSPEGPLMKDNHPMFPAPPPVAIG